MPAAVPGDKWEEAAVHLTDRYTDIHLILLVFGLPGLLQGPPDLISPGPLWE